MSAPLQDLAWTLLIILKLSESKAKPLGLYFTLSRLILERKVPKLQKNFYLPYLGSGGLGLGVHLLSKGGLTMKANITILL